MASPSVRPGSDTCFSVPSDACIELVQNHLLLFSGMALDGSFDNSRFDQDVSMEDENRELVFMPYMQDLVLHELASRLTLQLSPTPHAIP